MDLRINRRTIPNFHRTHEALLKLGVDTKPLYRNLHIREKDLDLHQSSVSLATYFELLRQAAIQEKRPFIGIDIANTRDISSLGALGYMMANAPNFESSLAMVDSYLDFIMPGCVSNLIIRDNDCVWTYDIPGFSPELTRHETEMSLTQFTLTVKELFKIPEWQPSDVYFQHQAGTHFTKKTKTYPADNVHFDHYFSGVAFPITFLSHTLSNADPRLLSILEQQVQSSISALKTQSSLIERLTFIVASRLGKADVSADTIAANIGMSRRTLHRRLAEQGTTFNQIRETVVSKVSKEALTNTSVSITELAQQLGYSDSSAFDRAFKRLSGQTPSQYRKHQVTADSSAKNGASHS